MRACSSFSDQGCKICSIFRIFETVKPTILLLEQGTEGDFECSSFALFFEQARGLTNDKPHHHAEKNGINHPIDKSATP
ncbi:hypothetical protein M378DRAFT_162755 [Amanita muscaria Koide BX008]|uniref:Uncharacterized protein n=1 Tax=Amanita muscaria (strain Koide BX008) TaxID=946122 RepID=A0A0C2X6H5_AMAMK|nr:hypothetical protein M378DRAFT_162755 [Amanita muscaria Koide BX008]